MSPRWAEREGRGRELAQWKPRVLLEKQHWSCSNQSFVLRGFFSMHKTRHHWWSPRNCEFMNSTKLVPSNGFTLLSIPGMRRKEESGENKPLAWNASKVPRSLQAFVHGKWQVKWISKFLSSKNGRRLHPWITNSGFKHLKLSSTANRKDKI